MLSAAASTHAVLDVLAPAAFSTAPAASARPYASQAAPSPAAAPAASTSNANLRTRQQRPPAPAKHAHSGQNVQKKRSSTPRTPRRPPPPSAVDLLSEIRAASPSSRSTSAADAAAAHRAHNEAILSLSEGIAKRPSSYVKAFERGWLPLRRAGQAARLRSEDLARVLMVTTRHMQQHPDGEGTRWAWADVRELVLWLAGESDSRAVSDWAWSSLGQGWDGVARVVEVYELVARGEHLTLRTGDNAPDAAYKPSSVVFGPTQRARGRDEKIPVQLYGAYLSATALLRYRESPSSRASFASLIPSFLDPSVPPLAPILARHNHFSADSLLSRHATSARGFSLLFPSASPSSLESPRAALHEHVISFLRQASLAQRYYLRRESPGLEVLVHARTSFRKGQKDDALALWESVREAVESPPEEVGWISTEGWSASARDRLMRGERTVRSGVEGSLTGEPLAEEPSAEDASAGAALVDETAREPHVDDDGPTAAPVEAAAGPLEPLVPATLHQALVASFIAGFVRAQAMDHAHAIWTWLVTRTPPLSPGVVCWNGLLHGYAARGEVAAVESAFADMQRAGGEIEPDMYSWLERVEAHFAVRDPDEAMRLARLMMRDRRVLAERERAGERAWPETMWNRLINGLLACGRKTEAEALLEEMDKMGTPPTTVTINGFLKFYTRGSKPDLPSVARVLKVVSDHGLEADVFTFTMVLQALLSAGMRDAVARTIAVMEQARVKPSVTTYGAIINHLARSGNSEQLSAAVQLLDEMESKRLATNEVIYTSLIQGFLRAIRTTPLSSPVAAENEDGQHPYCLAALTLKQRMERRGIALNRIGYNAFIGAGLSLHSEWGTELAVRLYAELKRLRASGAPNLDRNMPDGESNTVSDTYYILLDGFVNMGDFARAEAVVREMRETGFVVRNRGLQRLVDRVMRRGYGY
ncbi:hypothetical protein Rhopal_006568-T1 [Rhodotorula paludigena]|uniref:Pentacotripeptide-repeat region of PRORP domain-containing protein n=1 Tax=Rhodotorula paludigena TaxID=86838 RepID=A0AAV5GLR2_9BASI|nr:hypothetical protein Rhopal_006568-T1 [Rhodotorula paludigena]